MTKQKKKISQLYGHIKRMSQTRLSRNIFQNPEILKNMNWIVEVQKDLKEAIKGGYT